MIIHVTYAYVDSYSSVVNHYFPDTEGKFLILFRILSLCAYITILARPCVLGNTLVVNHYFPDTEARPCVLDQIYNLSPCRFWDRSFCALASKRPNREVPNSFLADILQRVECRSSSIMTLYSDQCLDSHLGSRSSRQIQRSDI